MSSFIESYLNTRHPHTPNPAPSNEIKNRLDGLTVEQAYDLGRQDGRCEIQEAIVAASDYNMLAEDLLNK